MLIVHDEHDLYKELFDIVLGVLMRMRRNDVVDRLGSDSDPLIPHADRPLLQLA